MRDDSEKALEDILREHPETVVLYDQDILGAPIMEEMAIRFGRGDRNAGWVIQQLIKLSAAMQSESEATLILDADTLLLTKKTWFTRDKVQLLQVANEYHADFMRHVQSFFGVLQKTSPQLCDPPPTDAKGCGAKNVPSGVAITS